MKIGLFPGQGIAVPLVRETLAGAPSYLEAASEALELDLGAALEEAEASAGLPPTTIMQPAIFTASVARWRSEDRSAITMTAGHSLGEYAALVAADAMDFSAALKVLKVRSAAMEDVSRSVPGGMCAILRLDLSVVEEIASSSGLRVANDNAPGQVVLSGPEGGMGTAEKLTNEAGGRFVRLEIVGPFHTDAVSPAVNLLSDALSGIDIRPTRFPCISNVTARPFGSPDETRELLCRNLVEGVRWRDSLEWAWERDVKDFEDIGPGNVVGKLARQIFGALDRLQSTTTGQRGGP